QTTGRSPFEILHGYTPRFHDGVIHGVVESDEEYTDPVTLQEEARANIEAAQIKYKRHYEKKRFNAPVFAVGDIVVMRRAPAMTGQPTKTQPKYRGPLTVTEVLPSDTYRVADLLRREGQLYASTAHVSQLKIWK